MKKRLITSFIFFIFTLVFLINPGSTTMAQESGKYPDYDTTEELFFLTPIKNIVGSTKTVAGLRQELALSGYEAYCAAEAISINPRYNTGNLIEKYLEQYPGGISLETDSIEKLGLSQAKYPIWRDVEDKKILMSSLEEYFGFKDVYEQDPSRSEITSAAINSLLSQKQACVQGWKNLVVQKTACGKLKNPNECALLPRPIPGTSFSVKTLIDELKRFKSSYEGKEQEGCEELFSKTNTKWKDLKIGLTNTPTYFDRAYRYGFVVATIHTLAPEGSGGAASKIFNFFTNATREGSPKDEVLVAAFKLPDIGTNKGRSGHEYWDDPLDLTRMSLTTAENNRIHTKEERPAQRAAILENAIGASRQSSSSNIFCSTGEAGSPGENATESCLNALPRALTDIINGNVKKNSCGDTEAVNFINDVAGLGDVNDPVGKIFKEASGGQVLLNLFAGSENNYNGGFYDPQNARSEVAGDPDSRLKSIFNISPDTYPPDNSKTTVDFYVVYPMGFELKAIEEAIKGAFFVKSQIETMDGDSSIADGFKMTGQEISLEGGGVEWDFIDKSAIDEEACEASKAAGFDPGKECEKTKTVKISIGQNETPEEIAILGGRLGWWLRNVQIALSSKAQLAYNYYKSCKTTEDFLLGVCVSPGEEQTPPGLAEENSCEDLRGLTIELPTMRELMKTTCDLAAGDKNKAQLLWGMMQVDGSPFLRKIVDGESSMSCGDVLINTCGASQITGVLIPQCIDKVKCPQAAYVADSIHDPWVNESRENPDIACNVEAQMDFILRKRLSEKSYLEGLSIELNRVPPSTKQLYYMMAGRNYGVPEEYLVQPACGGYGGPVSGCGEASYCECVMETFILDCDSVR